jgi:hypothetical protein
MSWSGLLFNLLASFYNETREDFHCNPSRKTKTMIAHKQITAASLKSKIKQQEILFAGNSKLKIYGTLHCKSGKRMKKKIDFFHL